MDTNSIAYGTRASKALLQHIRSCAMSPFHDKIGNDYVVLTYQVLGCLPSFPVIWYVQRYLAQLVYFSLNRKKLSASKSLIIKSTMTSPRNHLHWLAWIVSRRNMEAAGWMRHVEMRVWMCVKWGWLWRLWDVLRKKLVECSKWRVRMRTSLYFFMCIGDVSTAIDVLMGANDISDTPPPLIPNIN